MASEGPKTANSFEFKGYRRYLHLPNGWQVLCFLYEIRIEMEQYGGNQDVILKSLGLANNENKQK